MARYKLTQKAFIGNVLLPVGEIIEFDGKPAEWMIPVDGTDEEAPASEPTPGEALKHAKEEHAKMLAEATPPIPAALQDGEPESAPTGGPAGGALPVIPSGEAPSASGGKVKKAASGKKKAA